MDTNIFTLSNIRVLPDRAFHAGIKLNGKRVGEVSDSGHGGCDRYEFKDKKTRELFTKVSQDIMNEGKPGFEIEDAYVTRLLMIHSINAIRTGVVAVDDIEEFWESGNFDVISQTGVTKTRIIEIVKETMPYQIVWNKDTQEFVRAHTL